MELAVEKETELEMDECCVVPSAVVEGEHRECWGLMVGLIALL